MRLRFPAALLLLVALPCLAQGSSTPQLTGYVTGVTAGDGFDVNGRHIIVSAQTSVSLQQPVQAGGKQAYAEVPFAALHLYIGEPADVYGKGEKANHAIAAGRIVFHLRQPHVVNGFGIIDAVLPLPDAFFNISSRLIRADGYRVLISALTRSSFERPLASMASIGPNQWVHFGGTERQDGIVVADEAHFNINLVQSRESNLAEKNEYDPDAVPADKKQSGTSKFFLGLDVKQLPPSSDDAMQARVSRIGMSLVPKYQAQLPKTDETRIDFRFHVLDDNKDTAKWRDAMTLPNGIVLVPHAVAERLQNDSQLAAVLADNIACALEKQPLGGYERKQKMTVARIAGAAGGIFVPGLGLATDIGNSAIASHMQHVTEDQSGRVSLSLLQDAGYDVYQAPIAWWLLGSKKTRGIADSPLPRRAANLYQFLGESWPLTQDTPTQPMPPLSASAPTTRPSGPAAPR